MRTNSIKSEDILNAAIHLVALNGLENLSTKKVAVECGISEGSIFNYFKTKKDLLVQCLYHIDYAIDAALSPIPIKELPLAQAMPTLWYSYFDFLTSHGEYAKYYRQFRHSSYYTPDVVAGQNVSYSFFTQFIGQYASIVKCDLTIIWVFLIETTLDFAIRVSEGTLPDSPQQRPFYFNLLMKGISSTLDLSKLPQ